MNCNTCNNDRERSITKLTVDDDKNHIGPNEALCLSCAKQRGYSILRERNGKKDLHLW